MIQNVLSGLLRKYNRRKPSSLRKSYRRIALEPLESRRLLAATVSISGFAYLDPNQAGSGANSAAAVGFPGLTVQLQNVDSQGKLGSVVGVTQTAADGSYSFNNLQQTANQAYQVNIEPSAKLAVGTPSPAAGGTVGTNDIQLTLNPGQSSTGNDFTILGVNPKDISLRMYLASTGTLSHFLTTMHTAPTVQTGDSSKPNFSGAYTTGGAATSVTASDASITAADSATLTGMTVTIENPLDGSSEVLSAATSGTNLTQSYANGVLTIEGVASVATYQTVLQSVTYKDGAYPGTPGARTISVVVNDGTDASTVTTSTITVSSGTEVTPSVSALTPAAGVLGGGTSVTITGSGFNGTTSVLFGTTAATSFTVVSNTQITATSPAATSAGAVDLTVVNAAGTSATSATDRFTYTSTPAVSAVSPAVGALAGGTSLTITGSGFTGATSVRFGTSAATTFTVVSDTQITATSPAATTAGAVDVTVINPLGTSATGTVDKFTYTSSPTITSITPTGGPLAGGTSVTITGSGFTGATSVKFGATAATSFTVVSDTQITATSPVATAVGTVDITIVNPLGTSTTVTADKFAYTTTPTVTAISPSVGALAGGTSVTITGSGFTGATSVKFGTTAATSFTVNSDTQITVTSPAGSSAGAVDITVVNPVGTSATGTADKFTYTTTPAISSISPTGGPLAGGTSVTITGSGFTGATSVKFGATAATSFTVVSDSQITATSPVATAVGTVDITVVNPLGTSTTVTADKFAYTTTPAVSGVSPALGVLGGGTSVTITGSGFTGATSVKFGTTAATSFTVNSDTQITVTSPAAASSGAVDITVVNPVGISAAVAADTFAYIAAPAVTAVQPHAGPIAGGTSVTITGSGFTGATSVLFGTTAATSFTVNSDTQITATTPVAGTSGTVDVTVVNAVATSATGTADHFAYETTPAVTAVSPAGGLLGGGTSVTLTGSGFTGATSVLFGTTPATNVTVVSDTKITVSSPAATSAGTVDITVVNPVGTSATTTADKFVYTTAPAVTSVTPTSGPVAGGTSLTLTGSGFTGATSVKFGTTPATSFTVDSDTQITVTSPAAATSGTVDVTVVNPVGTSAAVAADHFAYETTPAVTAVSPAGGVLGGGTSVTLTGSGFTGATSVLFGTTPATNVTVVSDTHITVTSPAATSTGTVDITVVNPVGTSATTTADKFVYTTAPAVTSVTPTSGPIAGGTSLTIAGSGFTGATKVEFGTTVVTDFTVDSDTQITVTIPNAASSGTVDVTVVNPVGTSVTGAADRFAYETTPAVAAITPTGGPLAGGTSVTINGNGFTGATSVLFGTTAATNVTVVSDTEITATSPAASSIGTVDVTVVNPVGTSASGTADKFAYTTAPTVSGITPTQGPAGTLVTITGSGFTGTTIVRFGTTATTNFTVVSDTQITVPTPAGASAGTLDVTVVNPEGISPTSSADQFHYLAAPTVTSNPTAQSGVVGGTVRFTAAASGSPTPTVQWMVNTGSGFQNVVEGNGVSGSTTTTLTISPTAAMNGYQYEAVFTNTGGPTTTSAATLTVDSITTQPASVTVAAGSSVAFTAGTSNTADTVQWMMSTDGGSTFSNVTAATAPTYTFTAASGEDKYEYKAVFTTSGGGTLTTIPVTLRVNTGAQSTWPAKPTITPNYQAYGIVQTNIAGFTINSPSSANGDSFTYSIVSSGGGTPITGSGTITSTSQAVGGHIDLKALNDGTLTFAVTLVDASNDAGQPATSTAVFDRAAPPAFTVTPDESTLTSANDTSFGFRLANVEVGDAYAWNFLLKGSIQSVGGSGTVTNSAMHITGIDASSLPSGSYTLKVILTDSAGNNTAETVAVTVSKSVPAFTVSAAVPYLGPTTVGTAGFSVAGAEVGTTYSYAITSSNGGGPTGGITGSGNVASSTLTFNSIDLSALNDGTITYSVTLTDPFNHNTLTKTTTALLVRTAPTSGYSISNVPATITAANEFTSFTVNSPAPVDGNTYTYTYTITGSSGTPVTGTGACASTAQQVTGVDVSSLPDGTLSFTVVLKDQAGNVTNPSPAVTSTLNTAMNDVNTPTAIQLSTSSAPAAANSLVGVLNTVSPQTSSSYLYSIVNSAAYPDYNAFQIPTGTNQLMTAADFTGSQGTYQILVQSTDAAGNSIEQPFTITVNAADPIAATLKLNGGTSVTVTHNEPDNGYSGFIGALTAGGGIIGKTVNYSLISEPGASDNNNLFQISNGTNQLNTAASVSTGTYTVHVRSSSTFLISDVVTLSNVSGPFAFQVTLDPTILPAGAYAEVAAHAGLISLGTDGSGTGNWVPAVSANSQAPGSLAVPNYQGSYASFWAGVQASTPTATLKDVVGSSGVDLANNAVWAVVDKPGEYAVAVTVFAEQTFTVTVS